MNPGRILIVGGGIAGLSLANLLEKKGWEYQLIEKAEAFKPTGAGILLSGNSLRVYKDMGMLGSIVEAGNLIEKGKIESSKGNLLGGIGYHKLKEKMGVPTLGIHRASLHQVLLQGIPSQKIRTGTTLKSLQDNGNEVKVVFSDGSEGEFDLVVGADGLHSQVRSMLFGETSIRYSGYTCWRLIMPNTINFPMDTMIEVWGKGRRFGIVAIDGNRIYSFSTLNTSAKNTEMQSLSMEGFKQVFSGFKGPTERMLAALPEDTNLICNDLEDILLKDWFKGNVVLVGDAAHALTPNMGQGAGMSIEDVWVLVDALENSKSNSEALKQYQERRYKRVKEVRDNSYKIGAMGQWENGVARAIRNRMMQWTPDKFILKNMEKFLMGAPV